MSIIKALCLLIYSALLNWSCPGFADIGSSARSRLVRKLRTPIRGKRKKAGTQIFIRRIS